MNTLELPPYRPLGGAWHEGLRRPAGGQPWRTNCATTCYMAFTHSQGFTQTPSTPLRTRYRMPLPSVTHALTIYGNPHPSICRDRQLSTPPFSLRVLLPYAHMLRSAKHPSKRVTREVVPVVTNAINCSLLSQQVFSRSPPVVASRSCVRAPPRLQV